MAPAIVKDSEPVSASISSPCSNGTTKPQSIRADGAAPRGSPPEARAGEFAYASRMPPALSVRD